MAYCSQSDLEKLIPTAELTQLTTESGDEPDAAVVAEAIAKADAEIDAYLSVRYSLPLAQVPPLVRSLAEEIALFHLYSRRSVAPQVRRQKYEAAVAFLKQVAAGQAGVDGVAANGQAEEFSGSSRVFGREGLSEW
jgi:phage gp36-like protein